MEKSDTGIVAMKRANAASGDAGERVERRAVVDGKTGGAAMSRVQDREIMPSGAERIRQAARRKPKEKLTTLLHHITPETLGAAFDALKRGAAPGVDGVRWEEYEEGREARLCDLHDRVHRGAYRAKPVRRVNIPKPDGGSRPLGVAALEDKILQRAMVDTILTPIYESEFLGFSHGFRPGRGAHDALDTLAYGIMRRKTNWIVDADIRKYFDRIDRDWLLQFLEHRIGDKRVLRLIRKWLNAGVMDADKQADTGQGTPQGAVITPPTQKVTSRSSASARSTTRLDIRHVLYILYVTWPASAMPRKPKGSISPARCCSSARTCRTLSNASPASSPSRLARPIATFAKPSN